MRKFVLKLTVLFNIILLSSFYISLNNSNELAKITEKNNNRPRFPIKNSLTSHDPIVIMSDSDFISLGFSGNGDSNSPYLISGMKIEDDTSTYGIYVSGTTKFFRITDNYIDVMDSGYGIYINNIVDGTYTCFLKSSKISSSLQFNIIIPPNYLRDKLLLFLFQTMLFAHFLN